MIIWLDKPCSVTRDFGQGRHVRRQNRNATRHRLQDRQTKALVFRRHEKRVRALIERRQLRIRNEAEIAQPSFGLRMRDLPMQRVAQPPGTASQHQRVSMSQIGGQLAICPYQSIDTLSWLQRRNTQGICARSQAKLPQTISDLVGGAWPEFPLHAQRHRGDAFERPAEIGRDLVPDRLGIRDEVRCTTKRGSETPFELLHTLDGMRFRKSKYRQVMDGDDALFNRLG